MRLEQAANMEATQRETVYGLFPADFSASSPGDLCDPDNGVQTGPFGSQLHQKDYVPIGTPILTVFNFSHGLPAGAIRGKDPQCQPVFAVTQGGRGLISTE